jgi:rhodanese-related sulfurtransferase
MTPAFPASHGLEVTPEATEQALRNDEAVVIDVRQTYEWDAGRIDGARHIELERLAGQSDAIPRDQTVIFQCRLGARSAMAAEAFRAAGFDAYTMTGGLERWVAEGRPIVPEGGHVAPH